MADLWRLWKEYVFLNDPRVHQVTTRFVATTAVLVLAVGLVLGLQGTDEPAADPIAPAGLDADAACMADDDASPSDGSEGNATGAGDPNGSHAGEGEPCPPGA